MSGHAELPQHRVDLVHVPAGRAIDDSRPPQSANQAYQRPRSHVSVAGKNLEGEVGSMRRHGDDVRVVTHPEGLDDLLSHLLGRCGRQREHRRTPQCLQLNPQPLVRGAEVVPPFRNAVRLVDGDEAHANLDQGSPHHLGGQCLRGGHHEKRSALGNPFKDRLPLLPTNAAVESNAVDSALDHVFVLILEESQERRDDDDGLVEKHRGNLVAGRFSEPGRHDHQDVFARQDLRDDILLLGVEPSNPQATGGLVHRGFVRARLGGAPAASTTTTAPTPPGGGLFGPRPSGRLVSGAGFLPVVFAQNRLLAPRLGSPGGRSRDPHGAHTGCRVRGTQKRPHRSTSSEPGTPSAGSGCHQGHPEPKRSPAHKQPPRGNHPAGAPRNRPQAKKSWGERRPRPRLQKTRRPPSGLPARPDRSARGVLRIQR